MHQAMSENIKRLNHLTSEIDALFLLSCPLNAIIHVRCFPFIHTNAPASCRFGIHSASYRFRP